MENEDYILRVQLLPNVPLYRCSGLICFEVCCTCNNNFTLSSGATVVFAIAADRPPARKSIRKVLYRSISRALSKINRFWEINSPSCRSYWNHATFYIFSYIFTLISKYRTFLY